LAVGAGFILASCSWMSETIAAITIVINIQKAMRKMAVAKRNSGYRFCCMDIPSVD
jgi:frataxin-like iron-binding protein CyaY